MAVAQATKTSVKEVTRQQSVALMKNLTRAALSEGRRRFGIYYTVAKRISLLLICYLRNLFPSDCFRTTNFGNTTIRALCAKELDEEGKPTGATINEDALMLSTWQEAAFDALDKGYLRSIVLGVYTAEEDESQRNLIESYVFNFKYPVNGEIEMTLQSDKEAFSMARVRDEAVQLIRHLIRLAETMKPVPEERYISLKLFYYDDVVPEDYQPEHFIDATNEEHQFFLDPPYKVNVGHVQSKFHSLSLKVAFREDIDGADELVNGVGGGGAVFAAPTTDSILMSADSSKNSSAAAAAAAAAATTNSSSSSTNTTTTTTSTSLLEGVDPLVYISARQLVVSTRFWTVKGFVDGLKAMSVPNATTTTTTSSSSCSSSSKNNRTRGSAIASVVPIDVSQEQARRLLKQLENDGILRRQGPSSSTKYVLTPFGEEEGMKLVNAASAPSTLDIDGEQANGTTTTTLSSSSSSTSTTPLLLVPSPGDPSGTAASWVHRAVVTTLGNFETRKRLRTSQLEYELGLTADVARAVVAHLEGLGVLAPSGTNGVPRSQGRAILWSGRSSNHILNEAKKYLLDHHLPFPLPPKESSSSSSDNKMNLVGAGGGKEEAAALPAEEKSSSSSSLSSLSKKRRIQDTVNEDESSVSAADAIIAASSSSAAAGMKKSGKQRSSKKSKTHHEEEAEEENETLPSTTTATASTPSFVVTPASTKASSSSSSLSSSRGKKLPAQVGVLQLSSTSDASSSSSSSSAKRPTSTSSDSKLKQNATATTIKKSGGRRGTSRNSSNNNDDDTSSNYNINIRSSTRAALVNTNTTATSGGGGAGGKGKSRFTASYDDYDDDFTTVVDASSVAAAIAAAVSATSKKSSALKTGGMWYSKTTNASASSSSSAEARMKAITPAGAGMDSHWQ